MQELASYTFTNGEQCILHEFLQGENSQLAIAPLLHRMYIINIL